MKNIPEISIIIPSYNAASYIDRCLESITGSDADKEQYEIIAVDDSSTDETLDLLKKFAEKTPQMKVYTRHKAGPGGARNLGLNYAKGRYVMFVDIDDHIDSKNFAHLINKLIPLYNQDILGFDYLKCDEDGNVSPYNDKLFPYCREMSGAEYMNMQAPESVLWGYLFRRKFLIEQEIKFREKNIHCHEEFIARSFCLAQSIEFIPTLIYYFHDSIKESLTNKPDEEHQKRFVMHWLTVIEELQKFGFMLGDPLSEIGLERKLDYTSASLVKRLIMHEYDEDFISETIKKLESLGLYPLRRESEYGIRFGILSKVTNSEERILWWKRHIASPLINAAAACMFRETP